MPKRTFEDYLALNDEEFEHEISLLKETDPATHNSIRRVKIMLQAAKDEAQAAKDKVQAAETEAQAAKDKAQAAETEAQAAKDKVQAAETEAQAAKDKVQAAETEAQAAKDEAQAAKDEAQAAKDEAQAAKDKLEMTQSLIGATPAACFKYLLEKVPAQVDAGMTWRKPSLEVMKRAWNIVRLRNIEHGVPDDVSTLGNEDKYVHPVFLKLIKNIASCLPVTHSESGINCHVRPTLNDPLFVPDIVITRNGISSCSWFNAICLIELKRADSEAVGECARYCYHSSCRMPSSNADDDDDADDADDDKCKFRLGIASNMLSIMILYFPATVLDLKRSDALQLFPPNWIGLDEPTEGFKALCHALSLPLPSKLIITVKDTLRNKESDCVVTKTLFDSGNMAVHVINVNDETEKVAVKVAYGKYAIGIVMSFERAKYEAISRIDGISPFIIRLRSEFAVSNGFVMDCADETLPTWISSFKAATNPPFRNYHEDEPQLKLLLKPMFLNVLRGLKLLHHKNWYHMDVRPHNIVIYGGTARLIDWATASNESVPRELEFFQGHSDPFWPDPDKIPEILKQKAKWDLIGFGLVISFLCLTEENRELIFVRSGSRTEALQTYCSDYPAHSLVKVGYDIFNHCMNTEHVDYDLIEKLISDA